MTAASQTGPIRLVRGALLLAFFAANAAAEDTSPFGRATLSFAAVGGQNFAYQRHGNAEYAMPSIEAGKFVSRRIEIGLYLHPWISIRQPRTDGGAGGLENVDAFAVDAYGRWYFAPFEWTLRPYLEASYGPFYALSPVPAAGSRFNFLLEVGSGFSIPITLIDPWSLVLGYRFVHVSNAHIYERNPGWQFYGVVLGLKKSIH